MGLPRPFQTLEALPGSLDRFLRRLFFRRQSHGLLLHGVDLLQLPPQSFRLLGQAGQLSGPSGQAVFPLPQGLFQLRIGLCPLLAGGDQSAQTFFQRRVSAHKHSRLADEGRPFKDRTLHAAQHKAAVFPRQLRHGHAALRLIGAESAHGDAAVRGTFDGDTFSVPFQLDGTLHGAPVPGLVALLGRQAVVLHTGPLGGVDAVEHGQKKGAPGGFSRLVGQAEKIHAPVKLQCLMELSEGGAHFFDDHSGASLPSIRAVTSWAARTIFRRSSSPELS